MEYKRNIEVAINDIQNCVNLSRESLKYLKSSNVSAFSQFSDYLDRISTTTSYIETMISPKNNQKYRVDNVSLVDLSGLLSNFVNSIKSRSITEINYEPADKTYAKNFEVNVCEKNFIKILDCIIQKTIRSKASIISVSSAFADDKFLIRFKDNSKTKDLNDSAINSKIFNMIIEETSAKMDVSIKQLKWIDGLEVQIVFKIQKKII